jgi:hypothetical protein
MIANDAGSFLSNRVPSSGRWDGAFVGSFFPLVSIVIMVWILFSGYLHKEWIPAGLIGCVISASIMGVINYQISDQIFRIIIQELNIVNRLLMGLLVSIPQWCILKHKERYVWVFANSIGWALSGALLNLNFYLQVNSVVRTLIREISFVPLGLLISLYLYSYIYKSSDKKPIENQSMAETDSTSPAESIRAENVKA